MTPVLLKLPDLLCINLNGTDKKGGAVASVRQLLFIGTFWVVRSSLLGYHERNSKIAEMLSKCYRNCKIPFIYVKAHVIMHT